MMLIAQWSPGEWIALAAFALPTLAGLATIVWYAAKTHTKVETLNTEVPKIHKSIKVLSDSMTVHTAECDHDRAATRERLAGLEAGE